MAHYVHFAKFSSICYYKLVTFEMSQFIHEMNLVAMTTAVMMAQMMKNGSHVTTNPLNEVYFPKISIKKQRDTML